MTITTERLHAMAQALAALAGGTAKTTTYDGKPLMYNAWIDTPDYQLLLDGHTIGHRISIVLFPGDKHSGHPTSDAPSLTTNGKRAFEALWKDVRRKLIESEEGVAYLACCQRRSEHYQAIEAAQKEAAQKEAASILLAGGFRQDLHRTDHFSAPPCYLNVSVFGAAVSIERIGNVTADQAVRIAAILREEKTND